MKLASIDIGTNSIRLLVAEIKPNHQLNVLIRQAKVTRLGEGVNSHRLLKPAAISRTLGALAEYKKILEEAEAEKVIVAATSAVREAQNSQDFLNAIKNRFGWQTEVLSGETEANLSFLGALGIRQPSAISHHSVLVIDVGGGSTELIVGKSRPSQLFSLDIGSVRLTEMFIKNDPPLPSEIEETRNHIRLIFEKAMDKIAEQFPKEAIGLAGTFTTLSAIKLGLADYDWRKVHGSVLKKQEIEEIFERLISLPLEARKKIVGLEPERADVAIAGTLIILEILERLHFDQVRVSEQDLLDGLLYSLSLEGAG